MNLLKKIFSPSCLLVSLFLLLITFYQSEIHWNGVKGNYYLIYYIISTILIIFSIFTFFLSEKIKEYLIISLISILVGLYIFEGYMTFKKQFTNEKFTKLQLKRQLYAKEAEIKYDARSKIEVYNDLKKIDNNIKTIIPPNNHIKTNNNFFFYLVFQIQKSLTVMKMDIIQFMKVIDMGLIIQTVNWTKK